MAAVGAAGTPRKESPAGTGLASLSRPHDEWANKGPVFPTKGLAAPLDVGGRGLLDEEERPFSKAPPLPGSVLPGRGLVPWVQAQLGLGSTE